MTWRRILLLTSAFLLLLLGGAYAVLRINGARDLVLTAMGSVLACKYELAAADIDVTGGALTLLGLKLGDPARPGVSMLELQEARVMAEIDPFGSLLAVRSVAIDGLAVDLDLLRGVPRAEQLLKRRKNKDVGVVALPAIELHHGSIRVRAIADAPPFNFSDLEVTCLPRQGDDSLLQIDGSLRCVELAVPLRLEGTVDLRTGAVRAVAKVRSVRIDNEFLRSLAPFLPADAPRSGIGALVDELTFWLELPGNQREAAASEPIAGLRIVLSGVECVLPQVPYPLHDATVEVTATSAAAGLARARLRRHGSAGDLDITAVIGSLFGKPVVELRGSGKNLRIDDDMLKALQAFRAGSNVVAALEPTAGLADVELYIRQLGQDDEHVELDLDVHTAKLTYRGFGGAHRIGFPLPLADAHGRVRLRNDSIRIEDVVAIVDPAAGGGIVHCNGNVALAHGSDRVTIDVTSDRLEFNAAMRQALGTLLGSTDLYDQFAPTGAARVHVQVRPPDDPEGSWRVRVEPLQAGATWRRFPMPTRDVTGMVTVDAGGIELDLRAAAGSGSADLYGRLLPDGDGELGKGPMQLRIGSTGVTIDAGLRQAALTFVPELQAVLDKLVPSGTCRAELSLWRDPASAPIFDFEFELLHGGLSPPGMPLRLVDAGGTLYVHGDGDDVRIDLDTLRGRVVGNRGDAGPGAQLAAVGTLHRGNRQADDLTVVGREVSLDQDLAATLAGVGALDADTWQLLAPSGTVDTVFHWQREGREQPRIGLIVHLDNVRSDAPMLPAPATTVTGELEVQDNVLTFHDLRARILDTDVVCTAGHVQDHGDGRTECSFTIDTERFPLNDGIARLFQGPLHQAILDRQLRGRVNVDNLELQFLIPQKQGNGAFTTIVQGRIEALDVEMKLGTRLAAINGVMQIDKSEATATGGSLAGTMQRGSFEMLRHPCVDFRTRFFADAEKITLRELSFGLHGGNVRNRDPANTGLVYRFATADQPGVLSFDLTAQGISWKELLQDSGFVGGGYYGTLSGELKLNSLRGQSLVDVDAEGHLQIEAGYLGTVPVFTAIYAMMAESNRPRFESADVRFQVKDHTLRFDELKLASPLLAVRGEGTMTLDGYVDVVLAIDNLFGGSGNLLLVPDLIRIIFNRLVAFHLFGHLRDLHAEQRWLTERGPRRQPLLPVPPRLERPLRPDF